MSNEQGSENISGSKRLESVAIFIDYQSLQ